MSSPKYIGVLGGLGVLSTVLTYQRLQQFYSDSLGAENTCPIRMLSVDFEPINKLLPNRMEAVAGLLKPIVVDLDSQEVVCWIMPNNTMHQALDMVQSDHTFDKPVIHMGQKLTQTLEHLKPGKVMIIGTAYTMSSPYFASFIPQHTQLIIPNEDHIAAIDELRIFYKHSQNVERSNMLWSSLNNEYPDVDYFIVACTELSIAFGGQARRKIDTLSLLCRSAVDYLINTNMHSL